MKKKILFFLSIVMVLALALSVAACDDNGPIVNPPDANATYTVYLNNNYPSGGRSVQSIAPGEKVTRPQDPTREGYVFAGWYDEYEDGAQYDFNAPVNDDLRLYAYWINSAFFVTFKFNNGEADRVETVQTFSTVARPTDPQNEGYEFTGWFTDAANTREYNFSTQVSSSFTLYAGWRRSSVNATFNLNYTGSASPLVLNVRVNTAITLPTTFDTSRRLYSLDGWYDKAYPGATDQPYDLSRGVDDDVVLYAKWSRTHYLVTFNPNVLGMQSVEVEVPVSTGVANVPDFDRTGYTLDSAWYTSANLDTAFNLNSVHDDAVVYAKWNINVYNVSFDLNYSGAPAAPATQPIEYLGKVTRPTAPERDGYLFLGWYTAAVGGSSFNFETATVSDTFTLYAQWQEQAEEQEDVTITFHYNYPGMPDVYATATIDYGTALTAARLPAAPTLEEWYMFIGWFKEAACENEFSVEDIIVEDTNVYARILQEFRLEAEYVNLKDKAGVGSSVELNEEAMIFNYLKIGTGSGEGVEEVSGDYYVAGMYQKGLYIEFEVFASRDIEDAVFVMRVSSEFKPLHHNPLTPATYRIDVVPEAKYDDYVEDILNHVDVQDYIFNYELPLTLPLPNTEKENDPDGEKTPFSTVILSYHFSIKQGNNIIRLTTANEWDYGAGTFRANAPMIDYISIYTESDASIIMEEYEEFLKKSAAYDELQRLNA